MGVVTGKQKAGMLITVYPLTWRQIKEKGGQLKLVTDHSCVVESISDYCRKQKLQIHVVEPMNGIWELYIEN